MPIEYRPITDEEFPAFNRAEARAFLHHRREEEISLNRKRFEVERSIAALDGTEIVGTIGAYSLQMTAPGGAFVPTAGVTDATVQPTHRRRGVFTELVHRQFDEIRGRGEPLAALWASETNIYGRFGYGIASQRESWSIDRRHTAFEYLPESNGRVRFTDVTEIRDIAPVIWERVRPTRPTMTNRPNTFWERRFDDPEYRRGSASAYFCAVYETPQGVDGYVLYRTRNWWEEHLPVAVLSISELMAATDEAHACLWRFCFDVDLVGTIEARNRPVDDPVLWRLAEPRRLRRLPVDAIWLRVVDVPKALAARRYEHEGTLVLEVKDSFCSWNDGRYIVEGGPDGAECRATTNEPDLALTASDLAAVYMGAVRPSVLARAGRIHATAEGALRTADSMFGWHTAPWCPSDF